MDADPQPGWFLLPTGGSRRLGTRELPDTLAGRIPLTPSNPAALNIH